MVSVMFVVIVRLRREARRGQVAAIANGHAVHNGRRDDGTEGGEHDVRASRMEGLMHRVRGDAVHSVLGHSGGAAGGGGGGGEAAKLYASSCLVVGQLAGGVE